jgi:Arm DNA-binding domain
MYWRYDYRFDGKRNTNAIGRYPALSLAQARVRRGQVRDLLDKGIDPNTVKLAEKAKAATTVTVEDAAKGWEAQNEQLAAEGKRSPKTRARDQRMARYIVGAFGHKPVMDVVAKHLSDLLNIYNDAGSYATRVRIQSAAANIMGFAQGKGWLHTKPNPFVGISFGTAYRAPEDEPRPAIVEAGSFGNPQAARSSSRNSVRSRLTRGFIPTMMIGGESRHDFRIGEVVSPEWISVKSQAWPVSLRAGIAARY